LEVEGAFAAFGEHLQGGAAQDVVDAIADFAPHRAHRAGVAAMTRRVAVFLETFDRRKVTLDDLNDVGHVILAGCRASR